MDFSVDKSVKKEDADVDEPEEKDKISLKIKNEEAPSEGFHWVELKPEEFEDYLFECLYCDFKTSNQELWTSHVKYAHQSYDVDPEKPLKREDAALPQEIDLDENEPTCFQDIKFVKNLSDDWADLNVEDTTSSKTAKFACEHCPYKTNHRKCMSKHMFLAHTDPEKIKWFQCDQCPFKCKTRLYLINHMKRMHSDLLDWIYCTHCTFKTMYKHLLRQHIISAHIGKDKAGNFICSTCFFITKHKFKLLSHEKLHRSKDEMIKCEWCSYEAKTKACYDRHYLVYHANDDEIEWFKCDLCPFQSNVRSDIRNHIRKIHGLAKSDLDSHIRRGLKSEQVEYEGKCCVRVGTKRGVEKVFCGFCNYMAATQERIFEHILVHHNLVKVVEGD